MRTSGATTITTNIQGTIVIGEPCRHGNRQREFHSIVGPQTVADALSSNSPALGPDAQWTVYQTRSLAGGNSSVNV